MEADTLDRELNEHRDGSVRLRARLGEEAIGDFALDHHAPELEGRQPVEALDDDRCRDVVWKVRDELVRRWSQRGEVETEGVAPVQAYVLPGGDARLQGAIDLDRV